MEDKDNIVRDTKFILEILGRIQKYKESMDFLDLEFIEKMIEDWADELYEKSDRCQLVSEVLGSDLKIKEYIKLGLKALKQVD